MATLSDEIRSLLVDKETVKVLATVDEKGAPHAVIKDSLAINEDGNLTYLEHLESSTTNKNLVRAIWFDGSVTVLLKGRNGQAFQIKGKPVRNIITGPQFQQSYKGVRACSGDVDLAGIWVIRPEEVIDQGLSARQSQEEKARPTFTHLDRIAKR